MEWDPENHYMCSNGVEGGSWSTITSLNRKGDFCKNWSKEGGKGYFRIFFQSLGIGRQVLGMGRRRGGLL